MNSSTISEEGRKKGMEVRGNIRSEYIFWTGRQQKMHVIAFDDDRHGEIIVPGVLYRDR